MAKAFGVSWRQTRHLSLEIASLGQRHLYRRDIRHLCQAGYQPVAEREFRCAGIVVDAERQVAGLRDGCEVLIDLFLREWSIGHGSQQQPIRTGRLGIARQRLRFVGSQCSNPNDDGDLAADAGCCGQDSPPALVA
ncbi:hypothetical protein GA0061101_101440 [Rhizobium lusitanum]|uniref:Uncharacterized protein n=1 Tax=Rhizobium lusitanum TaxID=293958 RepID=A0A1C3U3I9_9HYPH|nr:hypothetical protein GA0061101_101440 [Rhizobium lusitanum]